MPVLSVTCNPGPLISKHAWFLTTMILEYATLKYEESVPKIGEGEPDVEEAKRKYPQRQMRPREKFYNPNLRGTGG